MLSKPLQPEERFRFEGGFGLRWVAMLAPLFDEVEERFSVYVFELRQVLKLHNLPIDGQEAVPALANSLTKCPDLRLDVSRMMRAMIRREREQISSVELLAVLMRAAGQSPAQHADSPAEAAVEELLNFILEVRYPHQAGEENKSPLLRPAKDAEQLKPSRVAYVEPSRRVPAVSLFEESGDGDNDSRKRIILVAACVAVLGLGVPLALHQHRVPQTPMEAAVSGGSSASGMSEQARSELHGTKTIGHRKWLSREVSPDMPETASRTTRDAETALLAGAPVLPRETRHTGPAGASGGVQPVRSATKDVYAEEAPLASGGAVAASANRAIVPVDLGTPLGSSRQAAARRDGAGFVHSASAGIMAGNVISSPSPAYPAEAFSARVEGEVTVRAVVGRDGNVTEARVVSGPPLLRQAALQAVEQWQYRPYLVDGKPAAMGTTAIVEFKLPGA